MMQIYCVILFLSVLLLIGCKGNTSTEPESDLGHGLFFSPENVTIGVGDQTELSLRIGDLSDSVFAVSFQMSYADSFVSFSDSTGIQNGDFFGPDAIQFARDSASTIHVTITRTQGQNEVSGSGVLCVFSFVGNAAGSCRIEVIPQSLFFYDSNGLEVEQDELEMKEATIHVD